MKGRALLHHDVRLDDRATLSSVPGVKNGTILRVDKHISQVKHRATKQKSVNSGPVSSSVDEEVVESIETSGNEEEISSEDERRISGSKRKRASRTSEAEVEDHIDDDIVADSLLGKPQSQGDLSDDPLNMTDTRQSNSAMALRIVKKENKDDMARERAVALGAQTLGYRSHSLQDNIAQPREISAGNATASTHFPKSAAAVPSHQITRGEDNTTFLSGINATAAANETVRLPLPLAPGPERDISARQCNACGRACACPGIPSSPVSDFVMPPSNGRTHQGRGDASSNTNENNNNNNNSHGPAIRKPTSCQDKGSSWTGM